MTAMSVVKTAPRVSTGNTGLDAIIGGGLPERRLYLVEGSPGSGKTMLALQFLIEGARRGESCLYITLSETSEELHAVADSHGWSLDGIDLFELSTAQSSFGENREQSVLYSWEVELSETVRLIENQVEETKPTRVAFDSLSEMRLLAQDPLRYRRQVLAMKQFFAGKDITVILVDDLTTSNGERDAQLHSLCHGVITMERLTLEFGSARRRLQVQKLRGVKFVGGYHDMCIETGSLNIFPRLLAAEHAPPSIGEVTPSGVAALDSLMNGGPLRGTSTLITGPAGTGKSTIALQYVVAACLRGEPATVYEFDERVGTLLVRAKALNLDLAPHIESGLLNIRQVNPAEIAPGEFASLVQEAVERGKSRLVVIDSLNGYLASMTQEKQLLLQMHELLSYLNQKGVVTFLINSQIGLVGNMNSQLNVSYVADAVIMVRFFETEGRIRKAISVVKNRSGRHEDFIRELRIDTQGVRVGDPLTEFKGVLTGTPDFTGVGSPLLEDRGHAAV